MDMNITQVVSVGVAYSVGSVPGSIQVAFKEIYAGFKEIIITDHRAGL